MAQAMHPRFSEFKIFYYYIFCSGLHGHIELGDHAHTSPGLFLFSRLTSTPQSLQTRPAGNHNRRPAGPCRIPRFHPKPRPKAQGGRKCVHDHADDACASPPGVSDRLSSLSDLPLWFQCQACVCADTGELVPSGPFKYAAAATP